MPEYQPQNKQKNAIPAGADEPFSITDNAARRIRQLLQNEPEHSRFRIAVQGGGCSGFQYTMDFDTNKNADDHIFTHHGVEVLIDETSLPLLSHSRLDYVETLGSAAFEIKNPNATAQCGCGNSFSV